MRGWQKVLANNRFQWDVLAFGEAAPEPGRWASRQTERHSWH